MKINLKIDPKKHFKSEINNLREMIDDGLVKVSDKSIELTEIGKDFSQNVSNIFDSYDPPTKSYEKRLEDIRKAKDKQAKLLDNI